MLKLYLLWKFLMQHWAADCTNCEIWFMLSFRISTAASLWAFSIDPCACFEASTPEVFAKHWTAMTHALHAETGNEATIHKHA